MPRPLLRTQQKSETQTQNILSASRSLEQQTRNTQMDKLKLDRLLRKQRSREYMEALRKLDAGGHVQNRQQVEEILDTIRNEFPEVEISGILLGYVAVCYLGEPYEVHTLDVKGGIIEHYKAGQALPDGMEKARGIALRGGYEFIEVYVDCCRAVSAGGNVSVIPC